MKSIMKLTAGQKAAIDRISGLEADDMNIYFNGECLKQYKVVSLIPKADRFKTKGECFQVVREYLVETRGMSEIGAEIAAKRAGREARRARREVEEAVKAERAAEREVRKEQESVIRDTLNQILSVSEEDDLLCLDDYLANLDIIPDLVIKDKGVKRVKATYKTKKLRLSLGGIYDDLKTNDEGDVLPTQKNVNLLIENRIEQEDLNFAINTFNHIPMLNDKPIDSDLVNIYNCDFGNLFDNWTNVTPLINNSIIAAYNANAYDSVLDSFEAFRNTVKWDGKKRAAAKIGIIGADVSDSPEGKLNKKMFFNTLYAMVKRQYQPGAVFDHILQLQDCTGGTGKTKFLERITETPFKYDKTKANYVTTLKALSTDRDNVSLRVNNIAIILDENASLWKSKAAYEPLKCELTKRDYKQRQLYKSTEECYLVRNIYFGTCNNEGFIGIYDDDADTSERRLWLVECHGERHTEASYWNKVLSNEELDQIWAEIFEFYEKNPNYDYNSLSKEEDQLLAEIQHRHRSNIEQYTDKALIESVFYLNYSQLGWNPSKSAIMAANTISCLRNVGQAPIEDVFRFEFMNTEFDHNIVYSGQDILDEFKKQLKPSQYQIAPEIFKRTVGLCSDKLANRTKNNLISQLDNKYYKGAAIINSRPVEDIIEYKINEFCDKNTLYDGLKEALKIYQ